MKKVSRILCIMLSMIMVFGFVGTATACDEKDVKITYMNGGFKEGEFIVKSGQYIPEDKVAPDPIPALDKVFMYWSEDGKNTDYVANTKPTKDIILYATYRDRAEGENVVVFNTFGGNNIKSQVIMSGNTVAKPENPKKSGADFDYWEGPNGEYNFATPVTKDIQLRAMWKEGVGQVLVLSSGDFDKVFSPFFSSSAYDSSVHGQTQAAMLSSDDDGKVYVGEDVPTVVKAYNFTTLVKGQEDPTGVEASRLTDEQKTNGKDYTTEYKFVIKNNIKFSDGVNLTIKDILFNMYLYLDPVYTGSSTMYSTKILGLNAYRTQNPTALEGGEGNDSTAMINARQRLNLIRSYYHTDPNERTSARQGLASKPTEEFQLIKDVQLLREYFWQEINSDWNSANAIEDIPKDYEQYGFTQPWQVFLLNCGFISAVYNRDGTVDKTQNNETTEKGIIWGNTREWHHDKDSLLRIVFNSKAGIFNNAADYGNYYSDRDGFPKMDLLLDNSGNIDGNIFDFGVIADKNNTSKDTLVRWIHNAAPELDNGIIELTYAWQCGQNLYSYMLADEKAKLLQKITGDGGRAVETISGITVETIKAGEEFEDVNGNKPAINEDHYVLKIKIVGVDPKAIWNFGFAVAPMHYYSDPIGKGGDFNDDDGYKAFNYPGLKDYNPDKPVHLGFKQLSNTYFNTVLRHKDIIGVPMGAGPFMATDTNNSQTRPSLAGFFNNGIVNFRRNEYFYTTGEKMNNVRFEFMRYKVVDTSKILDNLTNGDIDVGDPNAKMQNLTTAQNHPNLNVSRIDNNGYGYVGVNARYVPDLKIRQAIMHALNTQLIKSYYEGDLASIIYRPMSTVNWAYPKNATDRYPYGNNEPELIEKIKGLVKDAGFTDQNKVIDGALARKYDATGQDINLKFTFTVAGSTTDHPAFTMFENAARILNQCGFNITVKNDAQALSKLANGTLEVWAAAWQSTIDPDMYQVYHKKSQAQSVKNWGYTQILDLGYGTKEEVDIINALSTYIDKGRETLDNTARAPIYAMALDKVMDLAVEYPTYQRVNLTVYNKTKIDPTTVIQVPTVYSGLYNVWQIRLLK